MQEKVIKYLCQRVRQDWENLPLDARPFGVWIRYYAPIPVAARNIDVSRLPLQVWFLNENGLSKQSIWEYRRLQVVHYVQPWCGKMWGEDSNWWAKDKPQIGFAAFAEYEDSSDMYFDLTFGRLSGRGWRVKFYSNGEATDWECLWLS